MDLRKAFGLEDAGAEENTASFEIYPAATELAARELQALRAALLDHLLPYLQGYIWQRDRFNLQLSTEVQAPWQAQQQRRGAGTGISSGSGSRQRRNADAAAAVEPTVPHLWGSVSFGDNIEDEWFVVWLLLELTRAFPVTARVWDNDGEFLLIEAAYGLPCWLKPETAQNRVWLHGGTFHLVPLPRFVGDPLLGAATPSLAQALAAVRSAEVDTSAPPKMQAALAPRVSGFPARAAEQMHVVHALLPARVAHLLREEPQLLAAAVEAFHYRDPDDIRAASKLAAFPPQNLVMVAPTFSRCLYAQLALQQYAAPRGYPMPMLTAPEFKAAEVGLKLTAGFEMMYANRARFGRTEQQQGPDHTTAPASGGAAAGHAVQSTSGSSSSGNSSSEAGLAGDAAWAAFKSRLERIGYFQGSRPGSEQHSQLLEAAVRSYRQTEAYRHGTVALAAPAMRVDELLAQPVDPASFPPASTLPPPSSEAWLAAAEAGEKLEAELAQRQAELEAHEQRKQARRQQRKGQGGAAAGRQQGCGQEQQHKQQEGVEFDAHELAGKLRAFVDAMAGLEGAEVPSFEEGGDGGGAAGVGFDESKFAAELERVLGLGEAIGMRGWGGGGGNGMSDTSSEEGSSFFSEGTASDGSDEDEEEVEEEAARQPPQQRPAVQAGSRHQQQQPPPPHHQHAQQPQQGEEWDADTGTDSDDDAEFMQAYGQALDAQLAGTRMVESFERAPAAAVAAGAQQAGGAEAVAAPEAAAAEGEEGPAAEEAAGLRPVDVDMNLVKSLLASYGEQQGLPGPASNLAGLLGLKLPDQ